MIVWKGLKKGEHVTYLGYPLEVVSIRRELLIDITDLEVAREGFPGMTKQQFIDMFLRINNIRRRNKPYGPGVDLYELYVTRIEFKYTNGEET